MFIVLLPILVSAFFTLIVFYGPFDQFDNSDIPTIARLLTIISSYLVTDTIIRTINNFKTIKSIESESSDIKTLLNKDFHVSHVGRSDFANDIVRDKIVSRASQVKNTVVASNMDFVSRESHESGVALVYSEMLSRNDTNNWYDIVSENLKDLPRYNHMSEKSINSGQLHKFVLHENSNVPLINFVLIEYPEGDKEVYFGWLYSDIHGLTDVFQSSDSQLVNLFENYFLALQYGCKDVS